MSSCFTRVRLRTFTLFGLLLCCALPATAQTIALSLDSCKQLAASHNRRMAMEEAAIEKAEQDFRTARTNYLPKVSALASYMHIGDEVSLLSDAQKQSLGTLGTQLTSSFSSQVANLIALTPNWQDSREDSKPLPAISPTRGTHWEAASPMRSEPTHAT